jgi:hypothetical protein
LYYYFFPVSFNGRTAAFDSANLGSIPCAGIPLYSWYKKVATPGGAPMEFIHNLFHHWISRRLRENTRNLFLQLKNQLILSGLVPKDGELSSEDNPSHKTYWMIEKTLDSFNRLSLFELFRRMGYIQCYFLMSHGTDITSITSNAGIPLPDIKF